MDILIGYGRVSTADQNLYLPRDALVLACCEEFFEQKKSGKAVLAAGDISVAEIARRLGLNRSTFYNYFPQARTKATRSLKINTRT